MKHYFIINPAAGPKDSSTSLKALIENIFKDKKDSYEIYITNSIGDSYKIAQEASNNLEEETIFYACGGDGTCFDVVNGIAGKPKAHFGILPIGSCNDFLKTFKKHNFKDFEKVINGELVEIDIAKANDYYFLNELNIGFDAKVNDCCNNSKLKAKSVKKAYRNAIIKNLLSKLGDKMEITTNKGTISVNSLLLVAANGQFYGGKYNCAPFAKVDDGKLDLVVVNKISRLRFLSLIKKYEKGLHLNNPKLEKIIKYSLENKITITSNESLCTCLDGEIFHWDKIDIEVLPKSLKMIFPKVE